MSLLSLVGDCTTTSAVALASCWPAEALIVEADRAGGSLAAWLDTPSTPSLATIVANAPVTKPSLDSMSRRSSSGIRFIAAPTRTRAAGTAIDEAAERVFPLLAEFDDIDVIADVGRFVPAEPVPVILGLSQAIGLCHRQRASSAAASAVRLDRLTEAVESLAQLGAPITLVVIGEDPFDPDEIYDFIASAVPDASMNTLFLPDDPLAAAVLAGRRGVSARRLQRLPLMRAASIAATGFRRELSGQDQLLSTRLPGRSK